MNVFSKNKPAILCVSSGKGGVGKTTFSVNVAAALAESGNKVLLVDGDLGLANVDVILGVTANKTLWETVEKGIDPAKILIEIFPGFSVLPASSGVPEMANLSHTDQQAITNALDHILNQFDIVIIDSAAGIGESVLWFNEWAKTNCIIVSPDPTSMTDAYALIKILHGRLHIKDFYLIINGAKSKKSGNVIFGHMRKVLTTFLNIEPVCLGIVPQDNNVIKAVRSRKPLFHFAPKTRASLAIKATASNIQTLHQ